MQFGSRSEERLCPEDVGTTGEGSVGEPDRAVGEHPGDLSAGVGLVEPVGTTVAGHHVPAVEGDGRTCQFREETGIGRGEVADHPELAARRGKCAVVPFVEPRRLFERGPGSGQVTEEDVGLGTGRGRVVRRFSCLVHEFERLGRSSACSLRVAGDQLQRGGIDRREVTAVPVGDPLVGTGGPGGQRRTLGAGRRQRTVLLDAGCERRDVLGVDRCQIELGKAPFGLGGGAGASEGEDHSVGELGVARMLFEAPVRKVTGLEQLAAPLLMPYELEPCSRRPRRRTR